MSMVQGAQAFPGLDYEVLESAVMESSRGRWFLEEFSRRHRSADTKMLLDAIGKLENVVISRSALMSQAGADHAEIASLLQTIRKTRADIAAVRNHLLADGGAIDDNASLYERLAETAKTAADQLMSRTDAIQQTSRSLKSEVPGNPIAAQIDGELGGLQSLAWTQDVLSQRIAKAMGLLSHIDERVSAMAGEGTGSGELPAPPARSNLAFFRQDEEIFAPAEMKAAIKVVEAEKPTVTRIEAEASIEPAKRARVIVKRYTAEPTGREAPLTSTALPAAAPGAPVESPPDEISAPASEPPKPVAAAAEPPAPERKRVVIVRRKSSENTEIPLTHEVPESAVA